MKRISCVFTCSILTLRFIVSSWLVLTTGLFLYGEELIYDAVPIRSQASFHNVNPSGPVRIVYMPPAMEFNFYLDVWKGLSQEAEAYSHDVSIIAPQKDDPAEQLEMLKTVIDQNVSAIILSTHDEINAAPLIEKAVDKGIVVIIVNTDVLEYSSPVHGIIGYNQRKGTYNLGRYALSLAGNEAWEVGILEGEPGHHSTERTGGFEEAIHESALKVVSRLNGGWNTVGGYFATLEMLEKHPRIRVIFAANDFEAIGSEAALRAMERENILLFGNDGVPSAIQLIEEDRINGTVYTNPRYMGRISYQVAVDSLRGRFNGGFVETPTSLITKDNIGLYLNERQTDQSMPDIGELRVVSEVSPGFTNADGTGLFWDILREIYEPLGITVNISTVPLKRAQMMIDNEYADIMLGHYRGESEKMYFPQWHYGSHMITAVFKRDRISWSGPESLEGKKVAWIRGADYGRYLSVQIPGEESSNPLSSLLMLSRERIDVFLEDREKLFRTMELEREILLRSGFTLEDYQLETILELRLYPGFADNERGHRLAKIYDDRFPLLLSNGTLKSLYDRWDTIDYPFDR